MPKDAMLSKAFRVPAELWQAARDRASVNTEPRRVTVPLAGNESLSEAVRKFLERYVK